MVSDEVCGVVQGRFEFCGGIKSGDVMGADIWKLIEFASQWRLQIASCVWKLVSCDIICIISSCFSRFHDVSNKLDWIHLFVYQSYAEEIAVGQPIFGTSSDVTWRTLGSLHPRNEALVRPY